MKGVVCIEAQGKVKDMQPRDLAAYTDLETVDAKVALVLDGKSFAEDSMVIALGVAVTGEKVLLGFVQTATENEPVCTGRLLREVQLTLGLTSAKVPG